MHSKTLAQGMISGSAGGLVGTAAMQLFGAAIFASMGWPINYSFVIIGDSAAAFFTALGISLTGGAPFGVFLSSLIGVVFGAILGAAVAIWQRLRPVSILNWIILSIVYVEAMSLPLLAAGILSLHFDASAAVLWFGISVVMHLVYGLVLGIVMHFGLGGVLRGPDGKLYAAAGPREETTTLRK